MWSKNMGKDQQKNYQKMDENPFKASVPATNGKNDNVNEKLIEIPPPHFSCQSTEYLNGLRVFATFAVIMIHVFSPINRYFSEVSTGAELYLCVVLQNLWQWCVPIFVMITGVLFLNPEKTLLRKNC
jgi:hypothetical protein